MSKELGDRLEDGPEQLLRQVHPAFIQSGRISSQAFEAPKSHDGCLSVSRGSMTSPSAAYNLYTAHFGRQSSGVCAVTVEEASTADLSAYSDPVAATSDKPADPAHAVIDLSSFSKSQMKKKASKLASFARNRGLLFAP